MFLIAKAMGGSHFSVAADEENLAFCPLQFLDSKSDRAWALEWIDTILALNGLSTTPQQRNEINTALNNMYSSGHKTMTDFSLTIQDEDIRNALKQYTAGESMGHLLDAENDGLALSKITVFEIEELMNLGDKFALPVLLYLFRRIEVSLKGQPAVLMLDEAWLMLGHPVFREKIKEWLKVLRKSNCSVIMATQSLSDAANSGILDVINESTPTKIFLPNVSARNEDSVRLYTQMGLNQRQIEIIATAIPKKQYFYVSPKGRRLYELALGTLSLAFFGTINHEGRILIHKLEKEHGKDWVSVWLQLKGLCIEEFGVAA